ncbi:MAG: hypothetical protein K6F71_06800 [Ruminococcus sp.]|uniref:hypothetical protein n=1 Tax=Ruminococcus sp. TaxID=41978 RepID=UPI0025F6FBC7|nr:hypothetical protein [Ruminococcus sp.]MCR5540510.1 hypothetical protein [Ruminococcus sp.]
MSKLSEKLYERAVSLWDKESENEFVAAMAEGTLDEEKYRAYMLQDYFYLIDYIDILEWMHGQAEDAEVAEFLKNAADSTRYEKDTVHIPNMKKLGITDEEISSGTKAPDSAEYLNYMMGKARESLVCGITALLQCSWSYAYIAKKVSDRYGDKLKSSPYSEWFSAYTSDEYQEANQRWIDIVDRTAADITPDVEEELCVIFEKCAHYENCFWNIFISVKP